MKIMSELNYTTRCFFHSLFNNSIEDFQIYGFINLYIDDYLKKWHFEDSILAVFETGDFYHSSPFFQGLLSFLNAQQYYTVQEDDTQYIVIVFKLTDFDKESYKNFKNGKWMLIDSNVKEQCLKTGKVLPDESTSELVTNEIFRYQ